MKVDMADVAVAPVGMQVQVGVTDRASLVRVLVGMCIRVPAAVAVRVSVRGVSVIVVGGPVRVGRIRVILISEICVIAMTGVQVIRVRHIPVILVRGGFALVVVIAMLHIPEVFMRLLGRAIQMAGAGLIGMILVGPYVAVVRVKGIIEVIGMLAVGVIVEREIAVCVGVIAVVEVGVSMRVLMRRGIRMVGVWRRIVRVRDVGVRRRVRVDIGMH
jgi:hypothetical protein